MSGGSMFCAKATAGNADSMRTAINNFMRTSYLSESNFGFACASLAICSCRTDIEAKTAVQQVIFRYPDPVAGQKRDRNRTILSSFRTKGRNVVINRRFAV